MTAKIKSMLFLYTMYLTQGAISGEQKDVVALLARRMNIQSELGRTYSVHISRSTSICYSRCINESSITAKTSEPASKSEIVIMRRPNLKRDATQISAAETDEGRGLSIIIANCVSMPNFIPASFDVLEFLTARAPHSLPLNPGRLRRKFYNAFGQSCHGVSPLPPSGSSTACARSRGDLHHF